MATKDFGKAFIGRRGIVNFEVLHYAFEGGHIALWNGAKFKEPQYDDFRDVRDDPKTNKFEPATNKMVLWAL